MPGTTRDEFFEKIRDAAAAIAPTEPELPRIDEAISRMVAPTDDLKAALIRELELNLIAAHVAGSEDELATIAKAICAERGIRTALADGTEGVAPLARAFEAAGVAVTRWSAEANVDASFAVDAGLTGVAWAVAETGSLVLASSPAAGRMTSLAPAVHVALIRPEQIVPDLLDLFAIMPQAGLPSGGVLVTGPSKTADIELNLVTGVHGPGFVHAILLEG